MPNNKYFLKEAIKENMDEHFRVLQKMEDLLNDQIIFALDLILKCLRSNGTIFTCGNGGSASDSMHISSELVCRFKNERPPLKSISLSADSSILTSISNDYSYEDIFSRQIEALGEKNDLLIGISTSGNSKNIINAFKKAKQKNIKVVGLLGKSGGDAAKFADCSIVIPSNSTARIQEMHKLLYHIFCDLVEKELGYEKY